MMHVSDDIGVAHHLQYDDLHLVPFPVEEFQLVSVQYLDGKLLACHLTLALVDTFADCALSDDLASFIMVEEIRLIAHNKVELGKLIGGHDGHRKLVVLGIFFLFLEPGCDLVAIFGDV